MKIKAFKSRDSDVLFLVFNENILKGIAAGQSYLGYSLTDAPNSTVLGEVVTGFFDSLAAACYSEITINYFLSKTRDKDKALTFKILFGLHK